MKRNIVVIMSDQHNYKITGCYGNDIVRTPNMDKLAENGMKFTNAYTASPVCVPARMCFMTGKSPSENMIFENNDVLGSFKTTWAHYLDNAGYETALIGRMHFEGPDQYHGFSYVDPTFMHWLNHSPVHPNPTSKNVPVKSFWSERESLYHSGSGNTGVQYRDEKILEHTLEYLEKKSLNSQQPFALVSGYYLPHPPYIGREDLFNYYYDKIELPDEDTHLPEYLFDFVNKYRKWNDPKPVHKNIKRAVLAAYYACVEHMDEIIGKIINKIENSNLKNNTMIVYISDHGDNIGEHGFWGKCNMYEESVKVPMLIYDPQLTKLGSVCDKNVNLCNFRHLDLQEV